MSDQSYVKILVTTDGNKIGHEKSYMLNTKLATFAEKLELITGIDHNSMRFSISYDNKKLYDVNCSENAEKTLANYINQNFIEDKKVLNFHVTSLTGESIVNFSNVDDAEAFKLDDEDYDKREDSVRAWKKRNQLGRFRENPDGQFGDQTNEIEESLSTDNIGKRCKVAVKNAPVRLATIRFIGPTEFLPGRLWIGVEYDEPLGKNDGSVDGKRYFTCQSKYGGFVSLKDIEIGDFPPEDFGLDEI